jgi:PAS domain S-box-containing protein
MATNSEVYRHVFLSHPHATILFGLIDGRIEEANDAALALYGYGREELIGLPFAALSAPPEAKVHKRKDGSLLAIEEHRSTLNLDGLEIGVLVIRELVDRRAPAGLGEIVASLGGLTARSLKSLALLILPLKA